MLQKLVIFAVCVGFVGSVALWGSSANFGDKVPVYKAVVNALALPDGVPFGPVTAVATDKNDNVFVFHRGKRPIAVFDKAGKFLRSWGDDVVKTAHGLRIDPEGNVWTTDLGTHQVIKYDQAGKVLLTLGRKNEPGEGRDQFDKPADVAVAPSGEIYVADGYGNARVVKYSKDGRFVKAWGKKGKATGQFNIVHAIVLDAKGRLYVGDRENDRIQVFDSDGTFVEQWRDSGAPYGLFLEEKHMLVADGRGNQIRFLDLHGKVLSRFGQKGMGAGEFLMPHGICADSRGVIYVAEGDGNRVHKLVP